MEFELNFSYHFITKLLSFCKKKKIMFFAEFTYNLIQFEVQKLYYPISNKIIFKLILTLNFEL